LSHPPELKNYPDAIVKDFGERLSSALMTAQIRKSMGSLGGGKVYDLCEFDQEMRPFIEAYLQGGHDSTALIYAAMKAKEQELACVQDVHRAPNSTPLLDARAQQGMAQALEALHLAKAHVTAHTRGTWKKVEAECHEAILALMSVLAQQSDAAKVAPAKAPARAPDYVIEMDAIGGPCWVATGGGDPERTHDLSKAEIYATEQEARENAHAFASRYPSSKFRVRLKSEAEALQLMQGARSQTQTVSPTAPTGLSSQAQSTLGRWVNEHMERAVANGGMPDELVEIAVWLAAVDGDGLSSQAQSTIGRWVNEDMELAVANGANSVSMPDELVEIAVWLHELNKHEGCAPAATATHPAEAPIAEQPLYERPRA
jgi:hypothetical protein